MSDLITGLTAFMTAYEHAANSHDVEQVLPLIADDATYWFTDGSYRGREEICWRGVVEGQPASGRGRGTNVLVERDGAWQVQHEHLSD
jgi:hypothetical protein